MSIIDRGWQSLIKTMELNNRCFEPLREEKENGREEMDKECDKTSGKTTS